jgi:hypothetical protein
VGVSQAAVAHPSEPRRPLKTEIPGSRPVPKWGKRSSPGARRLPPGSRATHQNGLEYHGAVARAEAA